MKKCLSFLKMKAEQFIMRLIDYLHVIMKTHFGWNDECLVMMEFPKWFDRWEKEYDDLLDANSAFDGILIDVERDYDAAVSELLWLEDENNRLVEALEFYGHWDTVEDEES